MLGRNLNLFFITNYFWWFCVIFYFFEGLASLFKSNKMGVTIIPCSPPKLFWLNIFILWWLVYPRYVKVHLCTTNWVWEQLFFWNIRLRWLFTPSLWKQIRSIVLRPNHSSNFLERCFFYLCGFWIFFMSENHNFGPQSINCFCNFNWKPL